MVASLGWAELGGGAAQRPGRVVEIDGSGEGTGLVQRTGSDLAGAGEQASWLVAEELAQGGILRLPARRGRLRDARRHRARGDRPLARTAAAQRGLGNARPVAALVTRVPRANARWCIPQRLRDGASAEREHCVPRAVRALHCAIVFPPSLPIRCVGDNDDRSIRRGGAWHRPRRAVGSLCSARHAIRAWRQTKPTRTRAWSTTLWSQHPARCDPRSRCRHPGFLDDPACAIACRIHGPGDAGGPAQLSQPQSARGHLHEDGTSPPTRKLLHTLSGHTIRIVRQRPVRRDAGGLPASGARRRARAAGARAARRADGGRGADGDASRWKRRRTLGRSAAGAAR